jgi:hypothetical protein
MSRTKMVVTAVVTVVSGGLMSVSAATATTSAWFVNGTQLSGSAALATTTSVIQPSTLAVSGVITIECTALNGIAPAISSPNKETATSLEFRGCTAAAGNCSLAGQNAGGTIGTLPVTAEVTLQAPPAVLVTFQPSKSLFATIALTGAKCSLAGVNPVKGKALVEAPTAQNEDEEQRMYGATTSTSGVLTLGSDAASLFGGGFWKLASGAKWSFGDAIPLLTYLPEFLDFGLVEIGKSKSLSDTVMANKEVTFGKGALDQEVGQEVWSVEGNTCSEKTLKAGETCTVTIKFTPTKPRAYYFLYLLEAKGANGEKAGELGDEGSE